MSMTVPLVSGMSKTLCFLISGKAGVGKTHLSNLILSTLNNSGYSTFNSPFAYGVKRVASSMGWDGLKNESGRRLLQRVGAAGREYDMEVWAKAAFYRIESQVAYPFDVVTIDDWRFKNEYRYVADTEPLYKAIRIRVNAETREIIKDNSAYNDPSEIDLDDFNFDYVLDNNIKSDDFVRLLPSILQTELLNNTGR